MEKQDMKSDKDKIDTYREHNVTRSRGLRTSALDRATELGRTGVVQEKPVPHEMQCDCEDCRDIRRRYSQTIAREGGER